MPENMHEAISKFVSDLVSGAGFNYSPEEKNAISVVPDPQERVVKQWVRSSRREYGFNIVIVLPYSADADNINMVSIKKAQDIYDAIAECEKQHKYPQLPENCMAEKWTLSQNMPELSGINVEHGLARYQIPAKLIYTKQEV